MSFKFRVWPSKLYNQEKWFVYVKIIEDVECQVLQDLRSKYIFFLCCSVEITSCGIQEGS